MVSRWNRLEAVDPLPAQFRSCEVAFLCPSERSIQPAEPVLMQGSTSFSTSRIALGVAVCPRIESEEGNDFRGWATRGASKLCSGNWAA